MSLVEPALSTTQGASAEVQPAEVTNNSDASDNPKAVGSKTVGSKTVESKTVEAKTLGRKRDHTRDPEILQCAVDVLAETGYEGMTIEMVAARAKAGKATLYRRWASKEELVIDAVACMKRGDLESMALPDTGTLRGDLLAMIRPHSIQDNEKKMRVMGGLLSLVSRNPEMADAVNATIVEPRAAINRKLLQRAIDRGEISGDCDLDTLAMISPSMVAYRTLVLKKAVDRDFLVSIVDGVILPAVGIRQSVA